jgi:hypothetical protein
MNAIQNLQKEIEEQAISWGDAIIIGDHRTANRKNSAITKIAKRFRKDRSLGEVILVPLLKNTNPSVRLMASIHALDLEIHIKEAEDVLTQVASDPNIHVVQLMAQINLQKWRIKNNLNLNKT